jgi:hypothetical protein
MKRYVTLDESVGKTIEGHGVIQGEVLVLMFTDGTYTALELVVGNDNNSFLRNRELIPNYDYGDWVGLGLCTEEEWNIMEEEHEKACKEEQTRREIAEYLRLKAKYECLQTTNS